jgi:hypothetical protein
MFTVVTVTVRVWAEDDGGTLAQTSVAVMPPFGYSDVVAFAGAFASRVAAMSNARVHTWDVEIEAFDSAANPAQPGSVVENGAIFIVAGTPPDLGVVFVPAFDTSLCETVGAFAGVAVDRALAPVLAMENLLVSGNGNTSPIVLSSDILSVETAYVQYRE